MLTQECDCIIQSAKLELSDSLEANIHHLESQIGKLNKKVQGVHHAIRFVAQNLKKGIEYNTTRITKISDKVTLQNHVGMHEYQGTHALGNHEA